MIDHRNAGARGALALLIAASLSGCAATGLEGAGLSAAPETASESCEAVEAETYVSAEGCTVYKTFGPAKLAAASKVFVLMHGDVSAGDGKVDYIYRVAADYAERFADAGIEDFVLVTPARRGYSDAAGDKSSGERLSRDAYQPAVVAQSEAFLAFVRSQAPAAKITVVGHSGGAAVAGVIAGRREGLADAYVLVGTPTNVPRWRREFRSGPRRMWRLSLSPHDFIATTDPKARYILVTSDRDDSTPKPLSEEYLAQLQAAGRDASLLDLPGVTHNQLMRRPETIRAIATAAGE